MHLCTICLVSCYLSELSLVINKQSDADDEVVRVCRREDAVSGE